MKYVDARPHELVEMLRRTHVERAQLALRGGSPAVRLIAGAEARVDVDAENALAEIDGALTLSSAAGRLARVGSIFPIARPLPPLPLSIACAALPFFVDAFVQSAHLLSFDGDPIDTPRAPRSAAGPSLLHAACARPPAALIVRARVRVLAQSRAHSWREQYGDVGDAARRVRALVEQARAFSVDALGGTVLVLAAASVAMPHNAEATPSFAHASKGRFSRAHALVPGDVDAIAAALARGARVVAAPQMGRAAALEHGFEHLPIVDVAEAARTLAKNLERA